MVKGRMGDHPLGARLRDEVAHRASAESRSGFMSTS